MSILQELQEFHSIGLRAQQQAQKAVREGRLPKLDGTVECVDCGKPAKHYDHRDYGKPLDVQPVCVSCNLKRGKAKATGLSEAVILGLK